MTERPAVTQASSIEDKLFTVDWQHAHESHIKCVGDPGDWEARDVLLWACPAKVYTKSEESGLLEIGFENCVECNTCAILCPDHILWVYPQGGYGIRYKFG